MEKTMNTASLDIEIQEKEISFRNRDYFLGWQWVTLGGIIVLNVVFFQQGIIGYLQDKRPEWFGIEVEELEDDDVQGSEPEAAS